MRVQEPSTSSVDETDAKPGEMPDWAKRALKHAERGECDNLQIHQKGEFLVYWSKLAHFCQWRKL